MDDPLLIKNQSEMRRLITAHFPYLVEIKNYTAWQKAGGPGWIQDNVGPRAFSEDLVRGVLYPDRKWCYYTFRTYSFFFKNLNDAIAFKLLFGQPL